jgi:hypothetical protein
VNAGSGQPGEGGGTGSNYSGATAPQGSAGTILIGGGGGTAACNVGTSNGGTGGYYNSVTIATPGLEDGTATTQNGGDTVSTVCQCPSNGGLGCGGAAGSPGAAAGTGGTSSGTLNSNGWTLGPSGTGGQDGTPGQGGGGGGANDSGSVGVGGSGGGGGAGGCGGGAGTGGQTGGSSIGVLSYQATVTLSGSTVTTSGGGAGGSGGSGQPGQAGGGGGAGACVGGTGGQGGDGSGGGGGAGGLSSGIVWSGTAAQEPSFNGTTYTTQAAPVVGITLGAQGPGGGNGSTPAADAVFKSN